MIVFTIIGVIVASIIVASLGFAVVYAIVVKPDPRKELYEKGTHKEHLRGLHAKICARHYAEAKTFENCPDCGWSATFTKRKEESDGKP